MLPSCPRDPTSSGRQLLSTSTESRIAANECSFTRLLSSTPGSVGLPADVRTGNAAFRGLPDFGTPSPRFSRTESRHGSAGSLTVDDEDSRCGAVPIYSGRRPTSAGPSMSREKAFSTPSGGHPGRTTPSFSTRGARTDIEMARCGTTQFRRCEHEPTPSGFDGRADRTGSSSRSHGVPRASPDRRHRQRSVNAARTRLSGFSTLALEDDAFTGGSGCRLTCTTSYPQGTHTARPDRYGPARLAKRCRESFEASAVNWASPYRNPNQISEPRLTFRSRLGVGGSRTGAIRDNGGDGGALRG